MEPTPSQRIIHHADYRLGSWTRDEYSLTMTSRIAHTAGCSMETGQAAEALSWEMVAGHVAEHGPEHVEAAFSLAYCNALEWAEFAANGVEGAALERQAEAARASFREDMERETARAADPAPWEVSEGQPARDFNEASGASIVPPPRDGDRARDADPHGPDDRGPPSSPLAAARERNNTPEAKTARAVARMVARVTEHER